VLAIEDDGAGFPSNESQRIFEMFVQLEGSRSQAAGGLGLGLTIVRSLVEMHGGSIDARSAGPGKGAAFTVRLPKATPEIATQPAALPVSSAPARHRVLVVDDNPDAADSLGEMLTLHHFDVRVAHDGEEAFEIAKSFKPEVAFIDLNMPRMDGLELATALRAEPWATHVRLVALTGMGQNSDIEATRAAGFHAHLTKPAAPDEIVRLAGTVENNVVSLRPERRAS
jgi:CheY-like chemotaxis protein